MESMHNKLKSKHSQAPGYVKFTATANKNNTAITWIHSKHRNPRTSTQPGGQTLGEQPIIYVYLEP